MKHKMYRFIFLFTICSFTAQRTYAAFPVYKQEKKQTTSADKIKMSMRLMASAASKNTVATFRKQFKEPQPQKKHSKRDGRSSLKAAGILLALAALILIALIIAPCHSWDCLGNAIVGGVLDILLFIAAFVCFIVWLAHKL